MGIIVSLLGVAGSFIKGMFGLKESQAKVIGQALGSLKDVNQSDSEHARAVGNAIEAVYTHGNWLERSWRPMFMWMVMIIIISRFFGYVPPNISPEEISYLYDFMLIGLGGYIPLRSVEKIFKGAQLGKLLQTFIQKKIL